SLLLTSPLPTHSPPRHPLCPYPTLSRSPRPGPPPRWPPGRQTPWWTSRPAAPDLPPRPQTCPEGTRPAAGQTALQTTMRPSQARSEEHTSELQSRENLVCRPLLEKKSKK